MKNLRIFFFSFLMVGISSMALASNQVLHGTVTNTTCAHVAVNTLFNVIKETMSSAVRPEQISTYEVSEIVAGKLYSVQAKDNGTSIVDSQIQTFVLGNGDCEAEAYRILPAGTWTYLANAY